MKGCFSSLPVFGGEVFCVTFRAIAAHVILDIRGGL
jgi:hypothetical protein